MWLVERRDVWGRALLLERVKMLVGFSAFVASQVSVTDAGGFGCAFFNRIDGGR
jgi:hypothetical protein